MTRSHRTRIDDRDALRKRYIDEAEKIVSSDGVAALTARKLASTIGVAVGTTYNLFANLDEIIAAVNARTLDRLSAAISGAPLPEASVEAGLIALAQRYLDFIRDNRALWQALFETPPPDHTGALPNQPRFEALFGIIEAVLSPLFADGDSTARARSARVLWAGVHGISMLALGGRLSPLGVSRAEELVETLVICHVAGLRNH